MNGLKGSIARSNKLWCSGCERKIKKGENVIFNLDNGKMEDVYCLNCKEGNETFLDLISEESEREVIGIGQY